MIARMLLRLRRIFGKSRPTIWASRRWIGSQRDVLRLLRAYLTPCLRAWARTHPIATIVVDAADQQNLGFGAWPCNWSAGHQAWPELRRTGLDPEWRAVGAGGSGKKRMPSGEPRRPGSGELN